MERFISIKKKYSNTTTSIILMLFISMGIIFYSFISHEIKDKYKNLAYNGISESNLLLTEVLKDAEQGLYVIDEELELTEKNAYLDLLKLVFQTTSHTSTVYLGDDKNNFIRYPNRFVSADYLPTKRDWYQNSLIKNDIVVWSEPYVDHGTGSLAITGSKRVRLNEQINGVVGIDILLKDLSTVIKNISIGNNGYLFLVSPNGEIIANRDEKLLGENIESLYPNSLKQIDLDQNDTINSESQVLVYKKNNVSNMTIVAVIDNSDISHELRYLIYVMFSIFLLFLLVARRVTHYFSKKLTAPIERLVQMAGQVKLGNYNVFCDTASNDETGILINAFNEMTQSIQNNHVEMQALNEQLKASEEMLKDQYDALYESNELIKKKENRYKFIFEASKEGLWDTDDKFNYFYLTPHWYQEFGIDISDPSYEQWHQRIHPEDRERSKNAIDNHISNKTNYFRFECRVLNAKTEYRWIEVIGKSRYDENNVFLGLTGSHLDITIRKEYELKMIDMAYKDDLTKLYNRAYFQEYLSTYLQSGQNGTLIFTDINNFKHINDIYGHSFGDEVLKQLALRLKTLFGDQEKYVLARFSGDEFIVLIKNIVEKPSIEFIMNMLITEIKNTIHFENKFFQVSSSTGITIFPQDGEDVQTLLQNADIAMYHSKRISKKDYHFYDKEIKNKTVLEIQLENNLKSAIDNDEITVFFQPIISTALNQVTSFEALVRWQRNDGTWIYPDTFIPIAERTGLINDIGMIVFEKACAFIKNMNENKSYKVAVNISVVQLLEDQFANKIMNLTRQYGLTNDQIVLEITESMALESNENVLAKLFYLRTHKFGISLDDFGTGYSSFRNLISLPLSNIKMDRSIVQDSIYNENVNKLLTSIVDFAHKSNIEVVAEGIEDLSYYKTAYEMNVDFVQGYYMSHPVPEEEIQIVIDKINTTKEERNFIKPQ